MKQLFKSVKTVAVTDVLGKGIPQMRGNITKTPCFSDEHVVVQLDGEDEGNTELGMKDM